MVDGISKQFIKGERLKYYPSGMNLYSSSRGMKKPVGGLSNDNNRIRACIITTGNIG